MAIVVVADDNARVLEVMARSLRRAGHTVVAVTDGESAWQRVRDDQPDLAILDGVMPGTDGFEVCKRIHGDARTAHIPVIVCSGWLPTDDELPCATATLPKPFMPNELIESVARVLRGG
jgi:two-component system, OmpR family, phosphate regulon response regulator PhoB